MTGWTINLMTDEEAKTQVEAEAAAIRVLFMEKLDVDDLTPRDALQKLAAWQDAISDG